jgi:6-phosphogluconate dehydrogenase
MQIGIVGLGRMGGNIARRLIAHGHKVVGFNRSIEVARAIEGLVVAQDAGDLIAHLTPPRAVWVMLPAGAPTDEMIAKLGTMMSRDDIVIDGGNTFYRDDIRRAGELKARGIAYVDVGTSGGIWGIERGYCMMIGGERDAVERLDPVFASLAPGAGAIAKTPNREGRDPRVEKGYLHAGPVGAGHFVKMVHNGIEYGLMQAYAEGFDVLKAKASVGGDERYELDLADIAEVWRRGSVVSSWLLDLTATALAESPRLAEFEGSVDDSGEGRWTVNAAIEEAVAVPVLSAALYTRFRSRIAHSFGEKLLSAMRKQFGGHREAKTSGSKPGGPA